MSGYGSQQMLVDKTAQAVGQQANKEPLQDVSHKTVSGDVTCFTQFLEKQNFVAGIGQTAPAPDHLWRAAEEQ